MVHTADTRKSSRTTAEESYYYTQLRAFLNQEDLWSGDDYTNPDTWELICSRLVLPTVWQDIHVYAASEVKLTERNVMTFSDPKLQCAPTRGEFSERLSETLNVFESLPQASAYNCVRVARDGSVLHPSEVQSSQSLVSDPTLQKVNSHPLEPGSLFLRSSAQFQPDVQAINDLNDLAANMTLAISPPSFETQMHNDETSTLVCSVHQNQCTKLWMILPDGTSDTVCQFNGWLQGSDEFEENEINSLVFILNRFETLQLVLQTAGTTILNPYNCSHAVLTRGTEVFIGVACSLLNRDQHQSVQYRRYIQRLIAEGRADAQEVTDMFRTMKSGVYTFTS